MPWTKVPNWVRVLDALVYCIISTYVMILTYGLFAYFLGVLRPFIAFAVTTGIVGWVWLSYKMISTPRVEVPD